MGLTENNSPKNSKISLQTDQGLDINEFQFETASKILLCRWVRIKAKEQFNIETWKSNKKINNGQKP